jgi:hypothetical protein
VKAYKSPIGMAEEEMLGRASPVWDRAAEESIDNMRRMGMKVSTVLPALGRIARGE